VRLDIERREPFAGGSSFGDTGPSERLFGKVHFAIDPNEKGLPSIVDLDLAPRNAQGLVEFAAMLDIIKPVEPGRGNRRILYEFSNRGNRGLMGFNYSRGVDMSKPEYAGTGFLTRQGYTLMWSGWQGDLIDQGNNVVSYLPFAQKEGKPLRGRVRQEFNPMAEGILSMGVSAGAERGQDVQPYPVLDRSTATLTMRQYESDPRIPIPNSEWELAKAEGKNGEVRLTPSHIDLYIKGGFKPGWIYEFIMVRAMDDPDWIGQLTPNALSAIPFQRAVLVLLDRWATQGTPPPPSLLPKAADGMLVTAEEVLARDPKIPGVNLPEGTSRLPRYNYGPDFDSHGIMSVFPPQPFPGQEYPLRVPQIDADGNTIAGLRYPDIEVPLGTYNGWSLRKAGFAEDEQWWNTGSFVPFARTKAERESRGDPRLSIEERYPSHAAYIAAVTRRGRRTRSTPRSGSDH
jgi:hypothetical protein